MDMSDIEEIYLPAGLALAALYLPIFFLSLFRRWTCIMPKISLTISIVGYLLFVPSCKPFCSIPVFNTFIASCAIYYAQKVCEWILVCPKEFCRWSFFDIHHELFYYRVYTQAISVKKFRKKKKEIIYSGPIDYCKQFKSWIYLSCKIVQYYLIIDVMLFFINEIFGTEFYEKYYKRYLALQIIINQSSGLLVYLILTINYNIIRSILCTIFNRPLECMPDLFQQPYLAISPSDFWSRWHQIYRSTWIALIFKPTSKFILYHWPCASKLVVNGISSLVVFVFSGVVHEYPIYITFKGFFGCQIMFFVIQGLAVCAEHVLKRRVRHFNIPKSIGFFITFVFNGFTAQYYMKPWISFFVEKQPFRYSFFSLLIKIIDEKLRN